MDFILGFYSELDYAGIFVLIAACGFGFPIPEDLTVLIAGYLSYTGDLQVFPAFLASFFGVLCSDTIVYSIGRKGRQLIQSHTFFKRIFTERRIKKTEGYFERFGNKTIFFSRFLPGVRYITFFIAGTIKVNYFKFIIIDGIAALFSVSLLQLLSHRFGEQIELLIRYLKHTKNLLFFGLILITLTYTLYCLISRRKKAQLA